MINNLISRFPNGVNNTFDNGVFNNIPVPDRSILHEMLEDFDKYTAAQWAVGGVNPVAPALVSGDGGILSMATTGANGDSNYVSGAQPAFTFVAGKPLFFRVRAQVDDATLALFAAGLQVAVAANNFLTPADGVFLRKPAADTNLYLVSRVGGVETLSLALGVITAGTQFEASFAYDGLGNIIGALNGQVKASITPASITAVALKTVAGVQANSAAARTMLLDQLYAAKVR